MSRSSVITAGALALAAAAWLASGALEPEEVAAPVPAAAAPRLPLVEVATLRPQPVEQVITAQGDVRAFRRAAARSQTAGRIAEIHVDRGAVVEAGAPLLSLTLEGVDSRLREAEAVLSRRERDFDAAERLQASGYQTATQLRELETLLQSAREEVRRLQEDIANTTIRAPFAGRVDAIPVEPGEYVAAGTDVAVVIENVPLRTEIRVAQTDRARITPGAPVLVSYATGEVEAGSVCFISASADPATRTFQVEVRTPNAAGTIPSGISAEVRIPTGRVNALFVSPALLSLGSDGALGLKTVEDDRVAFHAVDVVRADAGGLWVSGLEGPAHVITLGQGFVQAGDGVRVAEAAGGALPSPARPHAAAAGATLPGDLCARAPALAEPAAEITGPVVRRDAS